MFPVAIPLPSQAVTQLIYAQVVGWGQHAVANTAAGIMWWICHYAKTGFDDYGSDECAAHSLMGSIVVVGFQSGQCFFSPPG